MYRDDKLQCNCPLSTLWGMQCEDSICVVLGLGNQWEYFSHKDIWVTWWNSYLQYAMCSSDDDNQKNDNNMLSSIFHKLEDKETIEINTNSSWLTNILIHNGVSRKQFKEDAEVVKCLKYPDSDKLAYSDFHSNSMDMFGFIQISRQQEIESYYEDDNDGIHFQSLESNEDTKKKDIIQPLYSPL